VSTLNGTPATALVDPVSPSPVTVVSATTSLQFDAVLSIRRRVFGDEQGMIDGRASDQDDGRSVQALAYHSRNGRVLPAGTGRLTLDAGERGEALISWVATLPEARGHGVGRAVMRHLIEQAEAAGAPVIALAAQMHAESFYQKLGFVGTGRTYLVRGVEHRWMVRRTTQWPLRVGA
jgi:predicted GNAT family N-acyltransferase